MYPEEAQRQNYPVSGLSAAASVQKQSAFDELSYIVNNLSERIAVSRNRIAARADELAGATPEGTLPPETEPFTILERLRNLQRLVSSLESHIDRL